MVLPSPETDLQSFEKPELQAQSLHVLQSSQALVQGFLLSGVFRGFSRFHKALIMIGLTIIRSTPFHKALWFG